MGELRRRGYPFTTGCGQCDLLELLQYLVQPCDEEIGLIAQKKI